MSTHRAASDGCAYCGLPLPRSWSPSVGAASEPGYCCFGCRFAAAVAGAHGETGAARWLLARLGMAVFLSMNVMVFTMALWTQDFYDDPASLSGTLPMVLRGLFRYLALLFALPVLFLLGGPLLANAWSQWRCGIVTTDALLVVGVAAAYLYSMHSVFRDHGPVYFEVGCAVLVFVTLGRWLEAQGRLRATAAIESLQKLLPEYVRRLRAGAEEEVPLTALASGDELHVLAGERVPCDGDVLRHPASVDEQLLTGESRAATKEPGERVFAGSLNLEGDLYLRATAAGTGTVLARLVELVRQARLAQGRFQRLADRVTTWFVPTVLLLSLGALGWHGTRSNLGEGILAALAVLLIACPCALGLATPLAVWTALGQAARAGVLFRSGEALERLAEVRALRFDKTGTLTTGQPRLAEFTLTPATSRALVVAVACRLAASSTHSYSRVLYDSLLGEASQLSEPALAKEPVVTLPGRGLRLLLPEFGGPAVLGSVRLMEETGCLWTDSLLRQRDEALARGLAVVGLGWGGQVQALFGFAEELRPEAPAAVAQLRRLGLDLGVLTGDSSPGGSACVRELGLPILSGQLPDDKVQALASVRQQFGSVAMVGDGVNDAPALAAADVGLALGCGADVSRDSAAVCLLGNDLALLPWTLALARQTVQVIRQNLFWAFIYNIGGIGLAVTGQLNPVLAALAMVLSSLLVLTNSLRLVGTGPGLQGASPAQLDPQAILPEYRAG